MKPTIDFRVKFTIGTSIVLSIIGTAVVVAYIKYENLRKVLEFGTTVAATAAGLTGASYAAQTLTRSAEEAKIDRTLSFILRWNDPSFDKNLVIQLLRKAQDQPNNSELYEFIRKEVDQDNDLKSQITTILNFFEEMALAINNKFVDENTLREFFRGIVLKYIQNFDSWIEHRRKIANNDKLFDPLIKLNNRWKNGN